MLRYPGCSGWHGSTGISWLNGVDRGFRRGGSGVFSFLGGYMCVWADDHYCGRGVAVVGTGL